MLQTLKNPIRRFLNLYPGWVCRREYRRQTFARLNERPIEYAFVFRHLTRLCPRSVLDVGTGPSSLPHLIRHCGCLVTASDNIVDYWPSDLFNRHYHVIDDDITNSRLCDTFDLITCISVLEHVRRSRQAVRNMFRLCGAGGHVLMTFPYSEERYIEDVYTLPGSSYGGRPRSWICQSYSRSEVQEWLRDNPGEVVEQEYWQVWEGDFWGLGGRLVPPRQVTSKDRHQLLCILIRKR